jgi:flavin reductase (DIM6/NTAB) family NADH-FMN oxidoreductase RutF
MFMMQTVDPKKLRNAFGSFMTGVTVVTARNGDGTIVGFTANSFSSVSIDPPLLLVCPGKFLSSYDTFANCNYFAVNILSKGQEAIANTFATSKADRFANVAYRDDLHGVPLIDNASAQFSCTRHEALPMGDHCILIGKVEAFAHSGLDGLGYGAGQYFKIGPASTARQDLLERT